VACDHLAPVAAAHELVVSHGNGPQIGLLALEEAAYEAAPNSPMDVLGAETQGMIGYLIEQELGNRLPFEKPLASLLTMIEVDPHDPAFGDPTKPIGPLYGEAEAAKLTQERGWVFKTDGVKVRRVVPPPAPNAPAGLARAIARLGEIFQPNAGIVFDQAEIRVHTMKAALLATPGA
jgi:carbamate kinase